MRVVVGCVLIVHTGFGLWSDLPPMNVTIPAVLLMGAGVLLVIGLWTPIVGTSIAFIEIWKIHDSRGQMGLAVIRNCRCRSRHVRTRFILHRCPPFRVEARRSSAPQNELSLSLRLSTYHQISCLRRG